MHLVRSPLYTLNEALGLDEEGNPLNYVEDQFEKLSSRFEVRRHKTTGDSDEEEADEE